MDHLPAKPKRRRAFVLGTQRRAVPRWARSVAKPTNFREGARQGSAEDVCPGCGKGGPLVVDFKKFGQHRFVACLECRWTFIDGDELQPISE